MATIAPLGVFQAFDDNGNPLSGGLLYTYDAGTTTPKATYTTAAGNISNTNPVVLDSSGIANVWLGDGGYKFVLKTSLGVTIFTTDNIGGTTDTAFGGQVNDLTTNTVISTVYQNSANICTGTITLSLLSVVSAGEGFYFTVRNQGTGVVTIDPDAGETIDKAATLAIAGGQSALIICDGDEWYSMFLTTNLLPLNNTWTGQNTFSAQTIFSTNVLLNGQIFQNGVLSSGNQINETKASDLASATTTNIAGIVGNYVHITGTTTITGLGTAPAGSERTLEFDGVLVLTHNVTSLILPTAANIATAAGDTVKFRSEGSGNWRCVSYLRANGRALTGNSTIFVSSGQTITASGTLTIAHGLGTAPDLIQGYIQCTTAEQGYSVGDKVLVNLGVENVAGNGGCSVWSDTTNLYVQYGQLSSVFTIFRRSATVGIEVPITPADWQFYLKAIKLT